MFINISTQNGMVARGSQFLCSSSFSCWFLPLFLTFAFFKMKMRIISSVNKYNRHCLSLIMASSSLSTESCIVALTLGLAVVYWDVLTSRVSWCPSLFTSTSDASQTALSGPSCTIKTDLYQVLSIVIHLCPLPNVSVLVLVLHLRSLYTCLVRYNVLHITNQNNYNIKLD